MKSIASAPGKIILFGEHFVVHGTKAILAAIDKRVTVTSTFTDSKTIKVNSQLGTIEVPISSSYEEVKSEFRPFVYLANKIINSEQNVSGLEITIDSDIPIGVGLGSSSACCVAATASISGLFKELSSEEILKISIEAERTIFPDTSGADCTVCTYGGMIVYDKIKGIKKIENAFDLDLIIANSMIPHITKNSVKKVRKFKENNEERFSKLCAHETKMIADVIRVMEDEDEEDYNSIIGMKMQNNQRYLEEIQVSNDTLDVMIHSLTIHDPDEDWYITGAKITGAGDGGCVIALVDNSFMDPWEPEYKGFLRQIRAVLGNDKECFSAKIDDYGVRSKIEK